MVLLDIQEFLKANEQSILIGKEVIARLQKTFKNGVVKSVEVCDGFLLLKTDGTMKEIHVSHPRPYNKFGFNSDSFRYLVVAEGEHCGVNNDIGIKL
jgi:hypothetical protein